MDKFYELVLLPYLSAFDIPRGQIVKQINSNAETEICDMLA